MKRPVVYAAAIAVLLATGAMGPPAHGISDRQQERRERTCRFQWLDRGVWTAREERRTALCVLDHWSVPGGWAELDSVIACESGWYRFASNGGAYLGLAQHAAAYWPSRVQTYMPAGWRIGPWTRWQNSRAQLVVTARMAHGSGWGAWACA